MEILRIRALRGPNRWSRDTAIQATISCTPQQYRMSQLDGFAQGLRIRFPGVETVRQLDDCADLSLASMIEILALALQVQVGCPVKFSRTTAGLAPGIFLTVVQYTEEAVGMLAVRLAQALCAAVIKDVPFDLMDALQQLRALHDTERMGQCTQAIVRSAVARGVPYRRLTAGSKVVVGWGSRQRRFQAQGTRLDDTAAIGEAIACDKMLTRKLLDAAGLPVPLGRSISGAEDAWQLAMEIGLPVVLKPRYSSKGAGVTVNLSSQKEVTRALHAARAVHDHILLERHQHGANFLLLVVAGEVAAAVRRNPLPAWGGRGATPHDHSGMPHGSGWTDVTDELHPEVITAAIEAACAIGLNICAVDLVCGTLQRSLEEQQGAVIGVNGAPDLRPFLSASHARGRQIADMIMSNMFPDGADGRIPVVAVTGTNGKTTTVRLIAHLLTSAGLRTGMTNTNGVYFEGQRIERGDCSGPRSARKLLSHPDVDAAVFEIARGGLLRSGLGFDRCQVAVVTNVGLGDHLGLNHIATVEDLAVLKRVIVENVTRGGMAVLNADDALVAGMAAACDGDVTYFGRGDNPLIRAHVAQGRRVVYVEAAHLVATDGTVRHIIPLLDVPLTMGGEIAFQVQNVMAAAAAAWAVDVGWDAIRAGLGGFVSRPDNTPGRFNLFRYGGATVIADYGHNRDAMHALVQAVESISAGRRVVVISGVQDRRGEDLRQQTRILGQAFDEVLLYQDPDWHGPRGEGRVLRELRAGLAGAPRTKSINEVEGELAAIDTALQRLAPGDLCLILINQVEKALAHLIGRGALPH